MVNSCKLLHQAGLVRQRVPGSCSQVTCSSCSQRVQVPPSASVSESCSRQPGSEAHNLAQMRFIALKRADSGNSRWSRTGIWLLLVYKHLVLTDVRTSAQHNLG